MEIIFEIKEKFGRIIYLSKERWNHILVEHPEIANKVELIKEALQNSVAIRESVYDEQVRWYYIYDKKRTSPAKFMFVSVKYLNGHGFIITVFYTRKIAK